MNKDIKMLTVLLVICVVSAGGLSLAYNHTFPTIEENKARALKSAQKEVMPSAHSFKKIEIEYVPTIISVSEALDGRGTLIGHIVLAETPGFQGKIRLIFGFDLEGKITRVRILESLETPGMGSRITEESFLSQFEGKTIKDDGFEVDAITGATISSTAVIKSVKSSLSDALIMLKER